MKIAMFTNLYLPMVGGVAISVERFSRAYRARGHEVLIVAPEFPDQPGNEKNVHRIRAIQNFNGTDFSVALPPGHELSHCLDVFGPELIHSHHPFLLGDAAVRAATHRGLPLVYTHHTMYEYYSHYVPLDSKLLRNFVIELSTRYTEFCNLVISPSESVEEILRERGVTCPIAVVPTGVETESFASGSRERGREKVGLDPECKVLGHIGRLAVEKNLDFLTRSVIRAMREMESSRFLVVGSGDMEESMRQRLIQQGLEDRAVFAGTRTGQDLADLYAAMDVFVFSSKSETQGMVLAEALAAGTPVVALDAPGAREVLEDSRLGRLVHEEDEEQTARAIVSVCHQSPQEYEAMQERARRRAEAFSLEKCVNEALNAYRQVIGASGPRASVRNNEWDRLRESIRREWQIWSSRAASLTHALDRKSDPAGD